MSLWNDVKGLLANTGTAGSIIDFVTGGSGGILGTAANQISDTVNSVGPEILANAQQQAFEAFAANFQVGTDSLNPDPSAVAGGTLKKLSAVWLPILIPAALLIGGGYFVYWLFTGRKKRRYY